MTGRAASRYSAHHRRATIADDAPPPPRGALPDATAALFRRLDARLRAAAAPPEPAPYLSLLFDGLAGGMQPNRLFAWDAEAGRVDRFYLAVVDAYLDHLVHADVAEADRGHANELLQAILDGGEPDAVLGFEADVEPPAPEATPARRVVYAYTAIRLIGEALEQEDGDGAGTAREQAIATGIARTADKLGVDAATIEGAYRDEDAWQAAQQLLAKQADATPAMRRMAEEELRRREGRTDDEAVREFVSAWWNKSGGG